MSDFDDDEPMVDGSDGDMELGDDDDFGEVEDVDVDEYAMDNNLNQSQEIKRQKSYEILSEEELAKRGKAVVAEVKDILGIPSKAACLILLRHFKWNKEKLIEAFTENSDKVLKDAGVNAKLEKKPSSLTKKYKCLICDEDILGKNSYALGCGHRYCLDCWKSYLEIAVKDGADCVLKRCPAPKCNTIIHDKAYKKCVSKQVFNTYKRYLNRSLVTDNPLMKFCPSPACSCTIRCDRKNRREAVKCQCGFAFCFQCADFDIGDHMPATCANVRSWQERASSESENIKWLIANTKSCPTCSKPIEKNGGCMHMTCRKNAGGCGHEFCWLCRGPWTEHGSETGGYYACNKYNASGAKAEDVKSEAIKTELEAYMFYYHRYDSHKQAMKVADEQRLTADNKAGDVLGKFTVRAQDTKFLREAAEQLIMNRRVLMWSYVYGFYLKDKEAEKKLFEFLQEDLEKHTNKLSESYEKPLDQIADYHVFMEWRENVTNYTKVTAKFLDKFVEGVARGLTVD